MALSCDDPIFDKLSSLESSLSPKNREIVPTLIELFGDMHSKMIISFESKMDEVASRIESKFADLIEEKDAKIDELQATNSNLRGTVSSLEDKLDALNAYTRKDTIIVSGALPQATPNEASHTLVRDLLAQKFPTIAVDEKDISVAHRLQPKKPRADGSVPPPNIVVKLVRRNLKIELIKASRNQDKRALNKIFINESLTPQRNTVLQTLIKLKKDHRAVKGVTSMQGDVFAYMEHPAVAGGGAAGGRHRDTRHCINTMAQLRKFCVDHLKKPLDDFIDNYPRA